MTNMRQVLKTDRLVLEPQSMARFDQWFAMERQRDEAGHRDLTEDQAWLRLCARQGMWDAYACGFYYLLDPVSGEMRGEAGFQFRRRGFGPGFDNHPEAAWAVASAIRAGDWRRRQCRRFSRTMIDQADASAWWR